MAKKALIIFLVVSIIGTAIYLAGRKKGKTTEIQKGDVLPDTYEKELVQLSKESGSPMLNRIDHKRIANAIRSSFGFFNDDENKIYTALKTIPSKSDYYLVVREFGLFKTMDMNDSLNYYLNDSEMAAVNNILSTIDIRI